ncbi:unnamed protein product [Ranitomeya imitator]|uniref:Solute carrier family 25 member 34 n=1 Tax=Ranitomeya imitator TaxID=111125 RepID=A0ABN9MB05_9NEOB|nr:unnamed protein product [Ranitomeya imitator]
MQGELRSRGSYPRHYRVWVTAGHGEPVGMRRGGAAGAAEGDWSAALPLPGPDERRPLLPLLHRRRAPGLTEAAEGANVAAMGAMAGAMGALVGSDSCVSGEDASPGAQNSVRPSLWGISTTTEPIYKSRQGVLGLWRGVNGASRGLMVGSPCSWRLLANVKIVVKKQKWFSDDSWLVPLAGGMISSVGVAIAMTPFDVVSTRLYNQPVDVQGRGRLYRGFLDCFLKDRTQGRRHGALQGHRPGLCPPGATHHPQPAVLGGAEEDDLLLPAPVRAEPTRT